MTKDHLSAKQRAAIAHLLTGKSQKETAALVSVAENTLGDWLKVTAFAAELRAGQRRILGEVVNRLALGGNAATVYLATVLADKEGEPTTTRLRAADRLLSHYAVMYGQSVTAADLEDLRRRIEELEGGTP